MNFENMNAENRNQLLPKTQRRCSFCRISGHNISRCHNNRLTEFEVCCATEVPVRINSVNEFKLWLTQNYIENPLLLKSQCR